MKKAAKALAATKALAYAASFDAGNRSAAKAGRSAWDEDDRAAACDAFAAVARLIPGDPFLILAAEAN